MSDMKSRSARIQTVLNHPCEVIKADFGTSSFDRHFHDSFSIGLVTRGMNSFSYRKQQVDVPAGAICIADPGEVHDGGLAGNPWSYLNIFVPMSLFQALSFEAEIPTEIAFQNGCITDRESCLHLSRMFSTLLVSNPGRARVDELAILAFMHLLNHHLACDRHTSRPEVGPTARHAIEIMTDHRGKGVSLEQLANETGASRYAVIRAVSAAIGITPVTYMTQLRIARAKKLVREGTSIAEAAVEAGFSDQPHLTRVMKRHMGITPGRLLPEI
ncbi:hypothetical protein MNBD_ALPHA01-480 [hydrothermal vent metagenome]|uniref:HTH araC/xylS-type domain-containing protein n=1 Tax=hydrothermal vent metagenome TaxID=652676 RepID=A0A3B0RLK8_9ZZZZ